MASQFWMSSLGTQQVDGPTLSAAAAATMLPGHAHYFLPNGYFDRPGKMLRVTATGRISCVVTTPGTARFDFRLGPTSAIIVFDTLAMNLNIVAKVNVGWELDFLLTARSVGTGTNANLMGQGTWTSEALIGSPVVTAGGNGTCMVPYNTAPAVGTGFDSTVANAIDMFFTQTVATGSMTLHQVLFWDVN